MDRANTGYIGFKLVSLALQESGVDLSASDVQTICSGMQRNRDAEIDYQELIQLVS